MIQEAAENQFIISFIILISFFLFTSLFYYFKNKERQFCICLFLNILNYEFKIFR